MVWKVRADCTYTTSTNASSRMTAVQNLVATYPTALIPTYASQIGRFPGGVNNPAATRLTIAIDFADNEGNTASAFGAELHTTLAASTKSTTLVSVHQAKGF